MKSRRLKALVAMGFAMRTYLYIPTLLLACVLGACGSVPSRETPPPPPQYRLFNPATQPYWSNPYWQLNLLQAVQSVVHLPPNAPTPAKPGIHATVQFTYDQGTIRDPLIVASTGSPDLDKLLLQQVMTAKIPKPDGLHANEPHAFKMPLQMFTVYESFQFNLYLAIQIIRNIPGMRYSAIKPASPPWSSTIWTAKPAISRSPNPAGTAPWINPR